MIISYFIFLLLFAFFIVMGIALKMNRVHLKTDEVLSRNTISVIVPFRNEANNIPGLIESLKGQNIQPLEVIFVDDHSTDDGPQQLALFQREDNVRVFHLPQELEGKKNAIYYGIQQASGTHCLTIDADVVFGPNYIESLIKSSNCDMSVLPVIMTSNSFLGRLFSFEYLCFNAFNFVFSSFFASSASGANLLFSRDKYLKLNGLNDHGFLASGDDHFLLRNFQNEQASIYVSNEEDKAVYSQSVENWRDYFNQRLRWLSKLNSRSNWRDTFLGLLFGIYFIGTFGIMSIAIVSGDWNKLMALLVLRLVIDFLVFSYYSVKLNVLKLFGVYPLFFIFYPLVFCGVIVGSLFFRPIWKGREIIKK